MSLNHIHLPEIAISELYKDCLVALNDFDPLSPVQGNFSIPYLGKNQKQILLLVMEKEVSFLPEETLQFLSGILSACKLNLDDIALVNLHAIGSRNYKVLMQSFRPKIFIMLGTDPVLLELPIHFPNFQVQQFNDVTFVSSPSLRMLAEDKLLKSKLWLCLKQIFFL